MPICKECNAELPTEGGLKRHMTTVHGTPETADPQNDRARHMAKHSSSADVSKAAPTDETSGTGDRKETSGRGPGKKTREEQERAEKIKRALDTVGRVNIRSLAKMPYDLWAVLLDNPEFKLTPDENKELVESYMLLAEAFGVDFTGKLWAVSAVCTINGEMIIRRLGMMGFQMDEERPGNGEPVQ